MAKLVGKKAELEKQIEKLSEKISKGDYKEKVPIKVQEQDAEKVGTGREQVIGLQMTKPLSSFSPRFTATPEPNRARKGERSHGQLQEDDVTLPFPLNNSGIVSSFLKSVHFITIFLVVLWMEINKALERAVFCKMESLQFELLMKKRMNANLFFSIFNKTYAEHTALYLAFVQKPEKLYLAVFLKIKVPLTRQHKIFNYTMDFNVKLLSYKTKEQWKVSDGLCTFLFRHGKKKNRGH